MRVFVIFQQALGKVLPLFFLLLLCFACRLGSPSNVVKTKLAAPSADSFNFKTPEDLRQFLKWSPDGPVLISAHRGGPYPGFPENSIPAFENAIQHGPLMIECDVAMTKDSVLVLLHDRTLDRTTTGSGKLSNYLHRDLDQFRLVDQTGEVTPHMIPTLTEVLQWGRGKVIFTLDVKGVPLAKVVEKIQQLDAQAYAMIITYNFEDAKTVYQLDPELVISVSGRNKEDLRRMKESGIPMENMMAFVGVSEREPWLYQELHRMGVRATLGTLGNLDKRVAARKKEAIYLDFYRQGADVLATDRPLEVALILQVEAVAEEIRTQGR